MKKTLVLFLNFLMLALLFTGCNKPSGEEEKTGGNEEKFVATGVYTFEPIVIEGSEYGINGYITLYDDGTWKYSGEAIHKDSAPVFIEYWSNGIYTVSGSEITLFSKAPAYDENGESHSDITYYDVFSVSNEGDISTWTLNKNIYSDIYHDEEGGCWSQICFCLFYRNNSVFTKSKYETFTDEEKAYNTCTITFKRNEL